MIKIFLGAGADIFASQYILSMPHQRGIAFSGNEVLQYPISHKSFERNYK